MMNKYGTFLIFKNVETNEEKIIPLHQEEEIKKYSNLKDWIRDYEKENAGKEAKSK